ncbi:hypothetical protein LCGC14_2204720 [marine sediment metagenome]|uniref:Uncharacterized protein n=1 Tax=marine sediment metagenome TaxID=412755 RepID=A0A0F9E2Z6_9ZZZZ
MTVNALSASFLALGRHQELKSNLMQFGVQESTRSILKRKKKAACLLQKSGIKVVHIANQPLDSDAKEPAQVS